MSKVALLFGKKITFDPTSLFVSDTGGWWDVSDHSTTFQDAAGTVPATANNDPVARINDKSGNGNNLVQATTANRPVLKTGGGLWWIQTDSASAQCIGTGTITLNYPMTRISAMQQLDYNLNGQVVLAGGIGDHVCLLQAGISPTIYMKSGAFANPTNDWPMTTSVVVSEFWNGASSTITINNGTTTGPADPGANSPDGLTIGANTVFGPSPTSVQYFAGISIGRVLTAPEIANCRTFFGAKAGLTL